ncbi:MAG: protein translocase subunit SecD [Alphaproteobacteria bacterium]
MVYFARWKIVLVLVVCALGVIFSAPNLVLDGEPEGLPFYVPHKKINLGLDLQGGSHLLLEVDVGSVLRERMNNMVDGVRTALRGAGIGYLGLGVEGDSVAFRVRDLARLDEVRRLVATLEPETLIETAEAGLVRISFTESGVRALTQRVVEQSIEIVRRRVDETGTAEPNIQRQGTDRILVQLPGIDDPERIKRLLGSTAKLTFHLVDLKTSLAQARAGRLPPGSMLLPAADSERTGGGPEIYVVRKRVMVSGENLIDSQPTFQDGQPVVSFRFDAVGARRFGEVTRKNVRKPFAIVLDGKVISAPVIREAILGGNGIVSGNFTVQSANDLSLLLRAGALPAPLTILEERTVGPGLGADSIRAGKIASLIGFVLVLLCMGAVYGLFGLMANVALLFNMALIMGLLSILQATLTLPGIAGIVLTIGMAVDANVLIFERIREEVTNGRGAVSAVDAGYRRALTTIIDSNITTLIAAILLFIFGSGPVKGFAVTLAIGLMTSMFTAIMVTRLLVVTWLRRRRHQTLPL